MEQTCDSANNYGFKETIHADIVVTGLNYLKHREFKIFRLRHGDQYGVVARLRANLENPDVPACICRGRVSIFLKSSRPMWCEHEELASIPPGERASSASVLIFK